jgi:hypothetical protein
MEAVEVTSGRRRAALTLHALAVQDRDWLLEQLPLQERLPLRELLAELKELGIPADAQTIRSALAEAEQTANAALPHAHEHALVLAREPAAIRGALLSLLTDPQRAAVLAEWAQELESRPTGVTRPAWSPRLQDALLKSWQHLASKEGQP